MEKPIIKRANGDNYPMSEIELLQETHPEVYKYCIDLENYSSELARKLTECDGKATKDESSLHIESVSFSACPFCGSINVEQYSKTQDICVDCDNAFLH